MTLEIDSATTNKKNGRARDNKMSRERELELARRWHDHRDEAARDLLVRAHLSTVALVARRYRRSCVTLDELIAEGNFGLLHAISKFEPDRGTRLVTYAIYWIRAYISNYVVRSRCVVTSGVRSKLLGKLRRERDKIAGAAWDTATADAHLAKVLGVSTDKVQLLSQRLDIREQPLSTAPGDAPGEDWLALPQANVEERLLSLEAFDLARSVISVALEGLDERERYIVERRLMADEQEQLSLAQVGRDLGVSRERARQLEERAKRKLAKKIAASSLADLTSSWHVAA